METDKIKKRAEIPEQYTWDLSDIFESDDSWAREYEELKKLPPKLAAYQGTLGESGTALLEFLRFSDELSLRAGMLMGYASMKSDQDTAAAFYQDMRGKAMGCCVALSGASAFSGPEIMAIPEEALESFYAAVPALEVYRRALYRLRRRREHILSAPEEKLLADAGEMADSPDAISSVFRNADLKFPEVQDENGVSYPLTNQTFVPLLENADRTLRRRAFAAYYGRLGEFQNTVAATLDAQFKQLVFFSRARKYPSALSAALDATEVPERVYLKLIDAVHANLDKMHRYVALRKRALGYDELHMYDIYVPIVGEAAAGPNYEQAKETVLKALSVLGEDYIGLLRQGFERRWIDVYENEGKRGGAYSSGSAHPHPYVLLNHKNSLDSMFTIAHEMGHALHSYYSCKMQPLCNEDYVIFVAEVASTCNEILLTRYLLDNCGDKRERAYLINHFLDQFKGTLYRQTMFAEFELKMGGMAERGEKLTADALNGIYLQLNKQYFGPDMCCDSEIALEWARIPHFFYNYYVFQYATGFAAAAAIANRILTEGESAVADYKRFLSSGSSSDPISLLKIAGVDMGSSEAVDSALELFDRLIDELETLL